MPCYVDPVHENASTIKGLRTDLQIAKDESNFHAAIACMLMRKLTAIFPEDKVVHNLDYHEAGITQTEFMQWWAAHRQQDDARKKSEAIEEIKGKLDRLSNAQLADLLSRL